jgi:phenylacetic acid degradation operon negative regulatory protein
MRRSENAESARSVLLTVLGEFVLPNGGMAWTSRLIEAMSLLGFEEASARQALARTATAGLLTSERVGRQTRWSLTARAVKLLSDGAARIYSFGTSGQKGDWDGDWLLLLVNVPEQSRHLRARLRDRLGWAGLGQLGAGTWVSPWADREAGAVAALEELALSGTTWIGRPGALGGVAGRVDEIWNLAALADSYRHFSEAAATESPRTDEDCVSSLVRLVHDWRHFPAIDPGLPSELLPPSWPASDAARLFARRRKEWTGPAQKWWRDATGA